MTRTRTPIAILCIAVVVFAVLLPAISYQFAAIFTALWLLVPVVLVAAIRRRARRGDEQSTSLLSLAASRAPPANVALA